MVGSICRVKGFTACFEKFSQGRSKVAGAEVAETTSKDFYAAGFDALVKRWDKCISVGGRYVEK
jgi:hypothetical protein